MTRKLWKAVGDTRLTFFSLVSTAILFFVGFFYADGNFELFSSLNETRIQDWAADNLLENLSETWWLPLLLLSLLVLGINTVACTWQRLAALLPTRKQRSSRAFFRDLVPSLIHALFAVVMVGHLVTITMGEWTRVPLEQGARIELPGTGTTLTIESIENEMFPPVDGQPRRIAQTRVVLRAPDGETLEIGHGDPLSYGGLHVILDRKKKQKGVEEKPQDCNEDEDYRVRKKTLVGPTLLVVEDPGVRVILPAFLLILVLMGWFYAGRGSERRKS